MITPAKDYTAAAILIASERGKDLGAKRPLCFIDLDYKPVFVQAVDHLSASKRFREIILLLHEEWVGLGTTTTEYWELGIVRKILAGQEDNMQSLERGISVLNPAYDVVAIHDGAYAVTPPELTAEVMDTAHENGFAFPAVEPVENDHTGDYGEFKTTVPIDNKLYYVQSPVCIKQSVLRDLFDFSESENLHELTLFDRASRKGVKPVPVITGMSNPRISTANDIDRCLACIRQQSPKYKPSG